MEPIAYSIKVVKNNQECDTGNSRKTAIILLNGGSKNNSYWDW